MARKYTKKSEYWNKKSQDIVPRNEVSAAPFPTLDYKWDDNESLSASASCAGGGGSSNRDSFSPSIRPNDVFKNINAGLLPWEISGPNIGISSSIVLCQKAAANISVVRNAIECCVEFSSSKLHIKTSNQTVKDFFTAWFNRIDINHLLENYMREYYRSGNVFLYKFVGKMEKEKYGQMQSVFGAKGDTLPIRYVILNPAQIYLNGGIGENYKNWTKVLSTFEVERLKNPKTPEDKQIFNSLPPEIKKALQVGGTSYNQIYMPLDPDRLYYIFYKKQDYEPMAVPMIYPVLPDIEWKLELKKMDMALSRTIEHVILLVTTGETKSQYGGGINPQNLGNLQAIFRNQTIGRVLVADYTTKGQWLIPDISAILGPEKYKQVEKDIEEGLQSILVGGGGSEKFAAAQIKAKVFIERLKGGQSKFLTSFLLPEIKAICQQMNFKTMPDIEFEAIDLTDQTNANRVYVRMAELGLITPEELFTAVQSGVLPDSESNLIAQKDYKGQRDQGLYYPLVGGSQNQNENGRPPGSTSPQTTKKVSPIGTSSASEDKFGAKKLGEVSIAADNLKDLVTSLVKKRYKIKGSLNEVQLRATESLAKSIISNEPPKNWNDTVVKKYINDPQEVNESIAKELNDIAIKYETTDWQAAILRHSRV